MLSKTVMSPSLDRPEASPAITAPIGVKRSFEIRPSAWACWHSPIETAWLVSSTKTFAAAISAGSTSCFPFVSAPIHAM